MSAPQSTPKRSSPDAEPRAARTPWRRLHTALMPDYNRDATLYWWTMVVLGSAVLARALLMVSAMTPTHQLQIVFGCAVAALAGIFPVRIPGSSNSFAAGEVFILLLLLLHGPEAAALGAAGEALVGSARSSKRWTSRLVSPAAACVSMLLLGSLFQLVVAQLTPGSASGKAAVLVLAMAVAIGHFAFNTMLITLVVQFKTGKSLALGALAGAFGWVGTTYAASALVAGLLYLAFEASGIGVMAGAVPLIVLLLVMLHYHFRQRETDDQAHSVRLAAAEREAEQSARHLRELRDSERRFHSAFSHAAIGMALVSTSGRMLQANPALCTLLQHPADALLGHDFQDLVHPDDAPLLAQQWQGLRQADSDDAALELRCRRADGRTLVVALHSGHFADGSGDTLLPGDACLIVQVQDITARRDAEARLQHIAYHDSLTSLANRIRFGECLAQAIASCQADERYRFAVMYLDFDRFKLINDTLGHAAGDQFLTMVALRIRQAVRPGDTVGRLGGDEFAILVDGLGDEPTTLAMADRLQQALALPYMVDGTEITSSASIGVTFSSVGYSAPGDVLRDADIAMYRAKAAGRARTAVFDASLRAQLAEQVGIERALRRAIEQEQLTLAYQPICKLDTGEVDSFEALVRWHHPELGPISPTTFIPIAEESALIGELTEFVLGSACRQMRQFESQLPAHARPRVHVNVSGTDICRPGFTHKVASALLSNGLDPAQLTLEITETMLMKRLDSALKVMGELREIGVGLSVDDFGTGYSSLSYLSTLPITSLKIDRSFVQQLGESSKNTEVVRAIVTLGHALGKTVIAEGIETPAQLAQLRALGCSFGQGYLLARPLTPDMALAVAQDRLAQAHTVQPPPPAALPPVPAHRVATDSAFLTLH